MFFCASVLVNFPAGAESVLLPCHKTLVGIMAYNAALFMALQREVKRTFVFYLATS